MKVTSKGIIQGLFSMAITLGLSGCQEPLGAEIQEAKDLSLSISMYVADWDGPYPPNLSTLYPEYMDDLDVLFDENEELKWSYMHGRNGDSPSGSPLFWSRGNNGDYFILASTGGRITRIREGEKQALDELLKQASEKTSERIQGTFRSDKKATIEIWQNTRAWGDETEKYIEKLGPILGEHTVTIVGNQYHSVSEGYEDKGSFIVISETDAEVITSGYVKALGREVVARVVPDKDGYTQFTDDPLPGYVERYKRVKKAKQPADSNRK